MEGNQEEAKSLSISEEDKSDVKHEDEDFNKIKDLQTLFDKLSQNEQLMFKFDRLKSAKHFTQIKNIDLIKFLRGTQYSSKIEQSFEFDLAFKKIEEGFWTLKCSDPDCESQAIMAFKNKNDKPTMQYCEYHFNLSNNTTDDPKYFKDILKRHKILLYELEVQLAYIQDRLDYIESNKNQNKISLFEKIKNEVNKSFINIKSTLQNMTERVYQIEEDFKTQSKNKAFMINISNFSFVNKHLAEWREIILFILSLISEFSSDNQGELLIQVMTDFKKEINLEEERKDIQNTSVSDVIYNSEYQMVNFPAQTLQSIKNFEEKISTIFEYLETWQKVYKSLRVLLLFFIMYIFCIRNAINL